MSIIGWIKHAAGEVADKVESGFNHVVGRESSDDKRNEQYAINDQIKAYKAQTDLSNQLLQQNQQQQDVLKRQVNEKQIRALRNNFRAPGGYSANYGATATPLGQEGNTNNKLGNA